ncbi:hypothetical protein M422DRAFT_240024 [Sphaerobolus stellatus SS14]|nr:hypothetical protein M422DRAFT_240024 [Sphaerobolus stellatus SS14]
MGSKVKKIPRRDVISADIGQLCNLIAIPPEPLALRLSSNLMVGVVRVFKMKHEMFEADVSNCVTYLKRNLHELHAIDKPNLEMAQPRGVRGDALNLTVDPAVAIALELDNSIFEAPFIQDWDLIFRKAIEEEPSNDDVNFDISFNIGGLSSQAQDLSQRKKLYQLDESHDHLFANLNDFANSISFDAGPPGADLSSSINLPDPIMDFDFGDMDVGLGEEMERDLAEAWNMQLEERPFAVPRNRSSWERLSAIPDNVFGDNVNNQADFFKDANADMGFRFDTLESHVVPADLEDHFLNNSEMNQDNDMVLSPGVNTRTPGQISSPVPPTKAPFPPQGMALQGIMKLPKDPNDKGTKKPKKRVRLIDPRTELTDEELKFQRYNYPEEMARLRKEANSKQLLTYGRKRFEESLWTPPADFAAPELVELWNRKVVYPVKSREAACVNCALEDFRPAKKRRIDEVLREQDMDVPHRDVDMMDANMDFDFGEQREGDNNVPYEFNNDAWEMGDGPILDDLNSGDRRSSDDPGQARHDSRASPSPGLNSFLGRMPFETVRDEQFSQSMFPWDNAGPSSSIAPAPGSASHSDLGLSFDNSIVRIRRRSRSGSARESPALSLLGGQIDIGMDFGEDVIFPGQLQL